MSALAPGSAIGILGGGQLGRMLALAAARLGFDVHVFSPDANSPAGRVAARETVAAYEDLDAVRAFAGACDVVTLEFENVPAETAAAAAEASCLRPGANALAIAQDRLEEKGFAQSCGASTAGYAPVDAADHLETAIGLVGPPAILKTRRLGYDGKGQARIATRDDVAPAWDAIGRRPAIWEELVAFDREASIIVARGLDGSFAAYDLVENRHEGGVLRETRAPANATPQQNEEARAIACTMMERLDYVGVMAVEFFVMADGGLLVNEFAPRVHNTGHWTLDAALCDQFEQHIRAVAGWPLGDTARTHDVVMTNLIGAGVHEWAALAAEPDAALHLYGKGEAPPGRKMGHVTRLKRR